LEERDLRIATRFALNSTVRTMHSPFPEKIYINNSQSSGTWSMQ